MFVISDTNLIIIIVVVLILIWLLFFYNRPVAPEYFIPYYNSPENNSEKSLEKYFVPQSDGDLKGLTVDTMQCSKSCCGNQWYTPFDGLTSKEIRETIANGGGMDNGPYVRTNNMCANGDGGVGCPCIPKRAYFNLVNRGAADMYQGFEKVEPTFHVGVDAAKDSNNMTQKEYLESRTSTFVNDRRLNDLELQRRPEGINELNSHVEHPLKSHGVANYSAV